MANMMQMMAKAQKFKGKMEELQNRVGDMVVDGSISGGIVTCQVQGRKLLSINISPDLIKPDEKEVMEDLVVAAVNNALSNGEQILQEETAKLMQEMGLPANMGLPF